MRKIYLNGKAMRDREQMHAYLRKRLKLPEYYGNNLDALYDCLTEWREETELIVRNSAALRKNTGKYGTRFLSVLAAATGLLGGVFLAKGVRIVGASKAAFLSILEPAAAFIWDVVIFRTALGAMAVAGVVLTFASFFAILLDKPKEAA